MLPTIWPWTSVINILLLKPGSEDAPVGVAFPELLMRHLRASTYLLLAVGTYVCGYQRLIDAAVGASWSTLLLCFVCVAARNMLITHAFYGGWHWFLYERTDSARALRGRKFLVTNCYEALPPRDVSSGWCA
eukprot:3761994-Prymnesium_polylepis.1